MERFALFIIFLIAAVMVYEHYDKKANQPKPQVVSGLKIDPIHNEYTEIYGCPPTHAENDCGIRYRVKNVNINNSGNVFRIRKGGFIQVKMDILHDCHMCGNAVNQILVGLSSDRIAQFSVWNGKKRSGGNVFVINANTDRESIGEDNPNAAEWVTVYFPLSVPNEPGIYYIRTRYAQAYTGNLMTESGLKVKQPLFKEPLGWWRIDRTSGPTHESNIGAIIVGQ